MRQLRSAQSFVCPGCNGLFFTDITAAHEEFCTGSTMNDSAVAMQRWAKHWSNYSAQKANPTDCGLRCVKCAVGDGGHTHTHTHTNLHSYIYTENGGHQSNGQWVVGSNTVRTAVGAALHCADHTQAACCARWSALGYSHLSVVLTT